MNQSRIAVQIVDQIKVALKTPKKVAIKYFRMLNAYFMSLQLIENDSSRYQCLKTLQQLLHEHDGKQSNMEGLLAQPDSLKSLA
jgi:predicted aldo/keto reductase-like oxidoreductase